MKIILAWAGLVYPQQQLGTALHAYRNEAEDTTKDFLDNTASNVTSDSKKNNTVSTGDSNSNQATPMNIFPLKVRIFLSIELFA